MIKINIKLNFKRYQTEKKNLTFNIVFVYKKNKPQTMKFYFEINQTQIIIISHCLLN